MNWLPKGFKGLGVWVEEVDLQRHMPDLLALESACFPDDMRDGAEEFLRLFEDPYAHGLLLFKDGKAIGLLSGTHLSENNTPDSVLELERIQSVEPQTFFIDNISMHPKARSLRHIQYLFQEMAIALKGFDYCYVSGHARISNGWSRRVRRIFQAEVIAHIPDWHDFGEPFDYVLAEIDSVPIASNRYRFLQKLTGFIQRFRYRLCKVI